MSFKSTDSLPQKETASDKSLPRISDSFGDSLRAPLVAYDVEHASAESFPTLHFRGTSDRQTIMNLVKMVVGAGSFALPAAFNQSGVVLGLIALVLLGCVSVYTMHLLGECELRLRGKRKLNPLGESVPLGYAEMGQEIFGTAMRWVVSFGIIGVSVGVCAVYTQFTAGQLEKAANHTLTTDEWSVVTLVILALLSQLRSFRLLAFTSVLGDLSVTAAFIVVIYQRIESGIPDTDELVMFAPENFTEFFGTMAFLFTVHATVIPIQQAMEQPTHWTSVVFKSYGFIILSNAIIGCGGYILYGNGVSALVLDDLQEGAISTTLVQVALAVDLLFSMPLILSAGRELLEQPILQISFIDSKVKQEVTKSCVRICVVGVICGVVFGVTNFSNLVNLVGGFANTLMGFILPPLLYIGLFRSEMSRLSIICNLGLSCLGVVAMVLTLKTTIENF